MLRLLLGAVSVVLAVLPLVVAIGAFLPWANDTIGRFGALVVSHLPALLLESALAASIGSLALALGGGRWTKLLVFVTGTTTFAMLAVTVVTTVFAWKLDVPFDLYNMARAEYTAEVGDERVVFATVDGEELHADLWYPNPPAAGGASQPAVVYVHGGAFVGGVLGSRRELFEAVSNAGIMVIDVEYRLSGPPRWADAPADVLCALGWVEGKAAGWGVDPGKVVIAGESAGGNLAMLAGYAAGSAMLTSSCGGTPVPPAGVFVIAPTADLAGIWTDFSIEAPMGVRFPEAYIGGPPSEYPERYDLASPFRLLRADLPPTYILTGANDHFVHPDRVTSVVDRLAAAGAAVTLVIAPFADHGFDGFPNGYGNQLQRVLLPRFVVEVTR